MLKIENLFISYGDDNPPAVKGFHMDLKEGEIICIVGESGSGKSTVLRSILGAIPGQGRITGGDIVFEGKSLLNNTPEQWRKIRGNEISMIFQDSGNVMDPICKIGKQFVEHIQIHEKISKKDAWTRAVALLEKMRLPDAENIMKSYPFQLSGGQRQRVGIAMAMAFTPKLLLADEPTSALDVTTQAQIVRQLMEVRNQFGTSLVIVTHNLGLAYYISDHIIVMKDGEIVDYGTSDEIISSPTSEYTKKLLRAVPTIEGERYV